MQAEAIVMNPCFYKGFFSTTDRSVDGKYIFARFIENHGFEYTKKLF